MPSNVANRGYNIFYDALNTYQYMMLYRSRDPNFLSTDHGVDMASAVARGLNAMAEIIAMPEPAIYYRCELQDQHHPRRLSADVPSDRRDHLRPDC